MPAVAVAVAVVAAAGVVVLAGVRVADPAPAPAAVPAPAPAQVQVAHQVAIPPAPTAQGTADTVVTARAIAQAIAQATAQGTAQGTVQAIAPDKVGTLQASTAPATKPTMAWVTKPMTASATNKPNQPHTKANGGLPLLQRRPSRHVLVIEGLCAGGCARRVEKYTHVQERPRF